MNVENLFIDTNVLVYTRDRAEPVKGPFAQNLLLKVFATGSPRISTQVLSEFFWVVTRKLDVPLTTDEAVADVRTIIALTQLNHHDVIPSGLTVSRVSTALPHVGVGAEGLV